MPVFSMTTRRMKLKSPSLKDSSRVASLPIAPDRRLIPACKAMPSAAGYRAQTRMRFRLPELRPGIRVIPYLNKPARGLLLIGLRTHGRNAEEAHHVFQLAGLIGDDLRSPGSLLDQRRILLRHAIHLH